jgi:hypothetical protein
MNNQLLKYKVKIFYIETKYKLISIKINFVYLVEVMGIKIKYFILNIKYFIINILAEIRFYFLMRGFK